MSPSLGSDLFLAVSLGVGFRDDLLGWVSGVDADMLDSSFVCKQRAIEGKCFSAELGFELDKLLVWGELASLPVELDHNG